ncbi:MAG: nucleotide exchange factor GrpE [Proteobacteria bacterium]|nr:MAG: nucleotide exchange factor GrpE [Pseudomonadota bacterium]
MKEEQSHAAEQETTTPTQDSVQDENLEPASEQGEAVDVDVVALQGQLEAAEAKANEHCEQILRLKADIENQRRRCEKQVEDAHKYAVQRFVENLLPVKDSLEMGLQAEGDLGQIREGIELTLKQFQTVMDKFNIEVVDPLGQPFNPELHQAMGMQASPDYDNNMVMAVMQKGYTLNGRVVRPAMVMVCKK